MEDGIESFFEEPCGEILCHCGRTCDGNVVMLLLRMRERVRWLLTKSANFIVISLYRRLKIQDASYPHKFLWIVKLPLKIEIFICCAQEEHIDQRYPFQKGLEKKVPRNASSVV